MASIKTWLLERLKAAARLGRPAPLISYPNVRELDDWLAENMPELWQRVRIAGHPFVIYSLLYEVCGVGGWRKVCLSDSIVDSAPIFLARLKEIHANARNTAHPA